MSIVLVVLAAFFVELPRSQAELEYDAKRRGVAVAEHEASLTPIGRRLEPKEIALLAVYLASPAAAAVVGQAINVDVDGGVLMTG